MFFVLPRYIQMHEARMALLGFAIFVCVLKSFEYLRINRRLSTTTFIILGMLRKVSTFYVGAI